MKTLVRKDTNVSLYLFDDAETVTVGKTQTVVGNPERLIIADCNTSNAVLYKDVTDPGDWTGWKYLFDGTDWTLNPNWTPPSEV